MVCLTELVYVRDVFDGSAYYRMNTVFKFYYQVWILLGLGGAYGVLRFTRAIRRHKVMFVPWVVLLIAGIGAGAIYTVLGPISYFGDLNGGPVILRSHGLSGLETLASYDPPDYAAITWMQSHVHGVPVVLEATGGEYSLFARVSIYTGLPTLLGWLGHEQQWRGGDPVLAQRQSLVNQIYSTGSVLVAQRLIRSNDVGLVYVGPCEHQVYARGAAVCGSAGSVSSASDALTKFSRFMNVIFDRAGVEIYATPAVLRHDVS